MHVPRRLLGLLPVAASCAMDVDRPSNYLNVDVDCYVCVDCYLFLDCYGSAAPAAAPARAAAAAAAGDLQEQQQQQE